MKFSQYQLMIAFEMHFLAHELKLVVNNLDCRKYCARLFRIPHYFVEKFRSSCIIDLSWSVKSYLMKKDMKMIKTKSVFEPKSDDDGVRILITRYYPRGIKKGHFDEWIRTLAPSRELLKKYKDEKIEWNEFEQLFLNQMTQQDSEIMIQTLANRARKNNITLLCYEKSGHNCHRYLVHDLIANQIHA